MRALALAAVLVATAALAAPALAEIHLRVGRDTRRVIHLGTFGFGDNGVMVMNLAAFALDGPFLDEDMRISPIDEPIGFVVDRVTSATTARLEKNYASKDALNDRLCFIDDPLLVPEGGPDARIVFPLNGRLLDKVRGVPATTEVSLRGLYGIYFYNCRGFNSTALDAKLPPSRVSFDVTFSPRNVLPGGRLSYLTIGETPLPAVTILFALVFTVFTAAFFHFMRQNPAHVRTVHFIMLFLAGVKTMSLVLESAKLSHFNNTGRSSALDVFYYLALTVKGVALFGTLLLLGSGWSIARRFLGDSDRKILMVLLPAQVLVNVLLAVIEETSEGYRGWQLAKDVLQVVDLACCCCILYPLIASMRNLQNVKEDDDKAAIAAGQMSIFRSFYLITVGFIYATRVVVAILESVLPYDYVWLAVVLREGIAAAFYLYAGYTFRPAPQSSYALVTQSATAAVEMRKEVGHA